MLELGPCLLSPSNCHLILPECAVSTSSKLIRVVVRAVYPDEAVLSDTGPMVLDNPTNYFGLSPLGFSEAQERQ